MIPIKTYRTCLAVPVVNFTHIQRVSYFNTEDDLPNVGWLYLTDADLNYSSSEHLVRFHRLYVVSFKNTVLTAFFRKCKFTLAVIRSFYIEFSFPDFTSKILYSFEQLYLYDFCKVTKWFNTPRPILPLFTYEKMSVRHNWRVEKHTGTVKQLWHPILTFPEVIRHISSLNFSLFWVYWIYFDLEF